MTKSALPHLNPSIFIAALAFTFAGAGCKEYPAPSAPPVEPKASATPIVSTSPTTTPSPTPSGPTDARVVPVSGGDAIIEPFWDRSLGAWPKWKVLGDNPKFQVVQQWSRVVLNWNAEAAGEGAMLARSYAGAGVDLFPYSQLVLSAGFTKGTKVTLTATTPAGNVTKEFVCEVGFTDQFVLPLPQGATHLNKVEVSLGAAENGPVSGSVLWLGLRDPQVAEIEAARWKRFSEQPMDVFLRKEPEPSSAAPLYNLLASKAGFEEAQTRAKEAGLKPIAVEPRITLEPHLSGASNQNLFGRRTKSPNRIGQTFAITKGDGTKGSISLLDAAQKAALVSDKEGLREVAKAAIQLALIPHWDVDFITAFPDGSWDQRCFVQSQVCEALSVALDLAGSWITPAGQALIVRRLAEDGLGNINYNVWKNPYFFTCNQLAAFSPGRLAAYALLEKQSYWGHVEPYTDLAFAELNESLGKIFLPDGGFPEGSGYLAYTLETALPAIAIYANARGKLYSEMLPPLLGKTDDYIEALRSTADPTKLVLVGDAQGGPFASLSPSVLSVMSKIRPGGASARMLAGTSPSQRLGMNLWALPSPDLTGVEATFYEPFILLPHNGIAASCRKNGELLSKLIVVGGPAKAGHNHEDRGSFVLEFAGETFAADPGGLTYSDATAPAMKHAQNHNMLVPVVKTGNRPGASNPARVAVIPEATGDATAFNATINSGVLWPSFYKSWKRTFTSPSASEITITDDYELNKADGVEFLWHTPLTVTNENGQVIINGARGRALITPPAGTTVEIIPSRMLGTRDLSTIRFRNNAPTGKLETKIHLAPLN
jgi:hypothetical protein